MDILAFLGLILLLVLFVVAAVIGIMGTLFGVVAAEDDED